MLELFTSNYPYTNFHELNLDWLISKVINLDTKITNFVSLNTIKYADPLAWDITRQYETNTVVIDPLTGTAYISTKPVPSGVSLSNPDYWTVIFDLQTIISYINDNLTIHNNGASPTLLGDVLEGDWILWNNVLFYALHDMAAGTALIIDSNIEQASVEQLTKSYTDALALIVGLLADLNTSDKTSIVNAINSLLSDLTTIIGDINNLTTSDTSNIVNAINSLLSDVITLIGNLNDLNTADKSNIVNAINSLLLAVTTMIGDINNLTTVDKTSIVNAINELVGNVGDITNLTTTDKSSIVNAINELVLAVGGGYQTLDHKIDQEILDRQDADATLERNFNALIQSLPWKNIKDLGAKGSSQLLSSVYSTVEEAQVDYPFVEDLTWTFDSAALQKGINDYSLVYIPEGTFHFNHNATLTTHKGSAIWIRGAERRLTNLILHHHLFTFDRNNRTSTMIMRFSDFTLRETGGSLKNYDGFSFIGGHSGDTPTDHKNWVYMHNIDFLDMRHCIYASYTGHSLFTHLWFGRCTRAFRFARDVSFAKMENCIAEACGQFMQCNDSIHDGISNGLYFINCQSVMATGNDFCVEGYQGVYFENCSSDLLVTASAKNIWLYYCFDVNITDCWVAGSSGVGGQWGIWLQNCHSMHICGNVIGNLARGIFNDSQQLHTIDGIMTNLTVTDNKFEVNQVDFFASYGHWIVVSNNTSSSNTTHFTMFANDSDYNVVTGNIMYGTMDNVNIGAHSVVANNIENAR